MVSNFSWKDFNAERHFSFHSLQNYKEFLFCVTETIENEPLTRLKSVEKVHLFRTVIFISTKIFLWREKM